jgi:subtilisin family serine protease
MALVLTYSDKLNGNRQRNFEGSETEFIIGFKGSMRSLTDALTDIFTFDWADPLTVTNEIKADRRLVMTGLNTRRGFARIHINEGPSDISDAATVEGILDDMKRRHTIADYSRALVEQDASTRKYTMLCLPGTVTIQLTKEYLEKDDPIPLVRDQETEFLKNNNLGHPIFERWTPGLFVVPLPNGKSGLSGVQDTIADLNTNDDVKFAEPTWLGANDQRTYPSEFQYSSDYTAMKTCRVVRTSGADAWNHHYLAGVPGTPEVKIAVVDTGFWNTHDDLGTTEGGTGCLENRGSRDWDFADNSDGKPDDTSEDGHGTAVTGVIGALSNGWGAVGVAPNCKIIPLRVDLGIDDMGTYVERADAIHYITSNVSFTDKWGKSRGKGQARLSANAGFRYIVNLSWTMSGPSSAVQDAIADAEGANVLVIAAAGDTQTGGIDITESPVYPASYTNVIPVGSIDLANQKPASSNFGNNVLFAAEQHYTTLPNDLCTTIGGTSISAAFVSGVAALLWSANYKGNNPDAFTKNVAAIRAILIDPNNATTAYPSNLLSSQKIGRVDASLCVSKAV